MAYEFKKLSDVNIIESMSDNAHVLVEENGEIVKIPKDATNKGLVKTINGTEPDADGDVEIRIPIVISIIDGSAVIPGNINNYSGYSVTEIVNFFRTGVPVNLIRMCIGNESVHSVPHTASDNINNGDNTFSIRVYHGDNLCPLIFNEANDTITFDPDWVAPAEPIPAPATAEVGQVIAVKAVDENGKPTEWEAVDMGGGSNVYIFSPVFDEERGEEVVDINALSEAAMQGKILVLRPDPSNNSPDMFYDTYKGAFQSITFDEYRLIVNQIIVNNDGTYISNNYNIPVTISD